MAARHVLEDLVHGDRDVRGELLGRNDARERHVDDERIDRARHARDGLHLRATRRSFASTASTAL